MGIRSSKDWVGEEILFLKPGQPLQFTAITRTPAKLLRITKLDMLHHFDPDYLRNLLNAATERYKHNMNRESNIYKSLSRIGKATVMSVQDRYEYKNKRKQHLDKIKIELPQVNDQ